MQQEITTTTTLTTASEAERLYVNLDDCGSPAILTYQ